MPKRRERRFSAPLTIAMTPSMLEWIEALSIKGGVTKGEVGRRALEAGLPIAAKRINDAARRAALKAAAAADASDAQQAALVESMANNERASARAEAADE